MFLLSVQDNFYIEFICRKACEKKWSLNFMLLFGFQASKSWFFLFLKIYCRASLANFPGRNNSLESHVFGFSNSIPYGLEESRELWSWLVGFLVSRHSKKPKIKPTIFSLFLSCYYGFINYFEILNFLLTNIIPRVVSG